VRADYTEAYIDLVRDLVEEEAESLMVETIASSLANGAQLQDLVVVVTEGTLDYRNRLTLADELEVDCRPERRGMVAGLRRCPEPGYQLVAVISDDCLILWQREQPGVLS
jgi:hypothetical protein